MITSSVVYMSQMMLLFLLAHGHGKKKKDLSKIYRMEQLLKKENHFLSSSFINSIKNVYKSIIFLTMPDIKILDRL